MPLSKVDDAEVRTPRNKFNSQVDFRDSYPLQRSIVQRCLCTRWALEASLKSGKVLVVVNAISEIGARRCTSAVGDVSRKTLVSSPANLKVLGKQEVARSLTVPLEALRSASE